MRKTKEGGITLIALAVTIVILIILATISVSIVINSGLISRTQSDKEIYEMERERERLELVKGEVATNIDHIGIVTVDTYIEELINQDITITEDVIDNGDGSKNIITDTGYSVIIKEKGKEDIEIIIEGRADKLLPKIVKIKFEIEDNYIKVNVIARRASDYEFYYKEGINDYGEAKQVGSSASYIIPNTNKSNEYTIKVVAINSQGNDVKEKIALEEDPLAEPPIVAEGMIPVKYVNGKWIKTTQEDETWYNYASSQKKWANVVLSDSSFNEDGTLDTTKAYSQLVWIPRYAYQITSYYHSTANIAGDINVTFIDRKNQNKEKTKVYSTQYPEILGEENGKMKEHVVHPAFTFGDKELSGFWIGKWECRNNDSKIMISSTNQPIRNKTINEAFNMCMSMNEIIKEDGKNPYGLGNDLVVDPHLTKNTEWGAVAYLSRSKYGVNTKEVNNSTTDNAYGVYAMPSVCEEYVAAYINNGDSNLTTYGKNLINADAKYKNVYNVGETDTSEGNFSVATPANGYFGDALYEISSDSGSWFQDCHSFPYGRNPFFKRGAHSGVIGELQGIFYYNMDDGTTKNGPSSYWPLSFRVVIPVL